VEGFTLIKNITKEITMNFSRKSLKGYEEI